MKLRRIGHKHKNKRGRVVLFVRQKLAEVVWFELSQLLGGGRGSLVATRLRQ